MAACGGVGATPPPTQPPQPQPATPPPSITVQFAASPATISAGQSTTLTWTSANATSVTISPGGSGTLPTSGSLIVSPTTTTTYTLTATGQSGSVTASATVNVATAAQQPTITLSASPTTIVAGQFTTLAWQSTSATSITITPTVPLEDGQPLALSGSLPVVPTATTTYTVTATGPGGTATATATVTVTQPAPTLTLSAAPASIIAGQPSTLSWTSTNATKVSIDNGVGSVAVPTGTLAVKPTATTTYTATATGLGGSATATATVTVQQQLGITLTAKPTSVASGQTTTLTWTSQVATAVDIQPGIGTVNLSGTVTSAPLTQTTTFTATAHDASGNTKTATATVVVVASGSLQSSIKHIVFLVQENRSFDNYFGFLGQYKASKGFANDVDGMPADAVQLDRNGTAVHPYHYQTACVENTSPSWNPSWDAWDSGKLDRFVGVTEIPSTIDPNYHRAMGFYNQDDLPYYYELATQFATSDRFFEPVMAGTIPNRMYLFTGTSFGHIYPDSPPTGGWKQKTIFDLLTENGISWRYYYLDNSIFLGQFSDWQDPAIRGNVLPISDWYTTLSDPQADSKLASVIFIERASSTGLDEHPDNNVQKGAATAAQIINALLSSPAWSSSVFIHTYDEFGGLFDHVPIQPVPAPDNIAPICTPGFDSHCEPGDFAHTGFRIPMIVISPWVKAHFVSHTVRETTSILKFIETRFGLPPLTARDAAADDMTEFFDFSNPALQTPPALPAQPTSEPCNKNAEINGQH